MRTASSYLRKPVHALIGGFHISSYYEGRKLGTFLAQQGLKVVCPCHCTGSSAKRGLRDVLGDVVLQCGVGMELKLEARGGASKLGGQWDSEKLIRASSYTGMAPGSSAW